MLYKVRLFNFRDVVVTQEIEIDPYFTLNVPKKVFVGMNPYIIDVWVEADDTKTAFLLGWKLLLEMWGE